MTYYPKFYVNNTYDNRIHTAIKTMDNLFKLITLADTPQQEQSLIQAYDAVASQFTEMTKDIPEHNGIKVIQKDIQYFANGLVRSPIGTIIAKPFEYTPFKGTNIVPKYDIFPKEKSYLSKANNTTSTVMKAYLKYKLTGKTTYGKFIKIPVLYDKINTLLNDFSFNDTLPTDAYLSFITKYQKCYTELLNDYKTLYLSIIHSSTTENELSKILYKSLQYYFSEYDFCDASEAIIPKLFSKRKQTTDEILNIRKTSASYRNSTNTLRYEYVPYLSEDDTNKFVELYNKLFEEKMESLILDAQNIEKANTQNIKYLSSNAEDYAKQLCYEFYSQVEKRACSEKFQNSKSYELYGHNCFFIEYTDAFHQYDTERSKILAQETILMNSSNTKFVISPNEYPNYNLRRETNITFDNLSKIETDILYNTDWEPKRDEQFRKMDYKSQQDVLNKYKDKAMINIKKLCNEFVYKNKNSFDEIITHIKESLQIMLDNILDINATFINLENQDLTNFLLRKKIISRDLYNITSNEHDTNTVAINSTQQ